MRRRSSSSSSGISSPFAAGALLLLVAGCFLLHGAAAARLTPVAATDAAGGGVPPLEDGTVKAVAADDGIALGSNGAAADDELSVSELMGAEAVAEEEAACDDECMQRRLLRDAHLDYIYTQHKGKP